MAMPLIGDEVYVPTLGDGKEYVGGLATVTHVIITQIGIKEWPMVNIRWPEHLEKMQDELKAQFGSTRAHETGYKAPFSCPL